MKSIISILLTLLAFSSFAQEKNELSNSFQDHYSVVKPSLSYSYNEATQSHNYSGNWDFDQDGIKDEVYFIGTGGAHLYYFLKVVLSTDNKPRDFNFIQTDFPVLTSTDTLNFTKAPAGFVVAGIGKHQANCLIVRLDDNSWYSNKKSLKKHHIKTKNIILSFENGKTKYASHN